MVMIVDAILLICNNLCGMCKYVKAYFGVIVNQLRTQINNRKHHKITSTNVKSTNFVLV